MRTHAVATKSAIELQHAASEACRLARAPSVAGLRREAAHACADVARARVAATGI